MVAGNGARPANKVLRIVRILRRLGRHRRRSFIDGHGYTSQTACVRAERPFGAGSIECRTRPWPADSNVIVFETYEGPAEEAEEDWPADQPSTARPQEGMPS
jgi:hypothetical protein